MRASRWLARSALSVLAAVLAGLHYAPGSLADTATVMATGTASTTEVFLIPHQDDEVLTFGPVIATLAAAKHEVWIVSYTTGANSNECLPSVAGVCTAERLRGLPEAAFVARRDRELAASAARLGVPANRVLLTLAGPRPADRKATTAYLDEVVEAALTRWPAATFYSMSFVDQHPDHRGMAAALLRAVRSGALAADHARFGLDRRYWQLVAGGEPSTAGARQHWRMAFGEPTDARLVRCSPGSACGRAVRAAVEAYFHPYGIGRRSVRRRLQITHNDPAALVHSLPVQNYRSQAFEVSTTATTRAGRLVVRGICTVADVPAATSGADAAALASGLEGRRATRWLAEAGGVAVSVLPDRGGPPVAAAPAVVRRSGGFRAVPVPLQGPVPVPALSADTDAEAHVAASCWAGGMRPSTVRLPLARVRAQVLTPHDREGDAVVVDQRQGRLLVRVVAEHLPSPGRVFVQLQRRPPDPWPPCAVQARVPHSPRRSPGSALEALPPAGSIPLLADGSAALAAALPPDWSGGAAQAPLQYAVTVWIRGSDVAAPALVPITVTGA